MSLMSSQLLSVLFSRSVTRTLLVVLAVVCLAVALMVAASSSGVVFHTVVYHT